MANKEHLEIIKQGTDVWNEWREKHPEVRPDLSGASLIFFNLVFANLSVANLSVANLSDTNLGSADLSRVIIGSTSFGDQDFRLLKGLETIRHDRPSPLSVNSIYLSKGQLPETFVKGTGAPDSFIEYMHALVNKPIQYYTCFISYSSKNQDFAERLYADLQNKGVRCWYAPEDMKIGDKIRHRIDESIRLYDKLLLVLSEHSIKSTWVAYEVERALNKEPQGIPNVLYPVRLDSTILSCIEQWARDIQETRHIGDFERWKDHDAYQSSFQRLLRDLKAEK